MKAIITHCWMGESNTPKQMYCVRYGMWDGGEDIDTYAYFLGYSWLHPVDPLQLTCNACTAKPS